VVGEHFFGGGQTHGSAPYGVFRIFLLNYVVVFLFFFAKNLFSILLSLGKPTFYGLYFL